MILSQAVEQYILHKRSLGIGFRSEAVRLRAFVQAIGDCEMHLIEPTPVLRFLEGNGPLTTFWFSKYHTLKAFYRYALARDYCASCPLPLSVPQKPEAFQPYIYTNKDIERLIDAADSRHRYRWLLAGLTAALVVAVVIAAGTGAVHVPASILMRSMIGSESLSADQRIILLTLRLPRIVAALLVGVDDSDGRRL